VPFVSALSVNVRNQDMTRTRVRRQGFGPAPVSTALNVTAATPTWNQRSAVHRDQLDIGCMRPLLSLRHSPKHGRDATRASHMTARAKVVTPHMPIGPISVVVPASNSSAAALATAATPPASAAGAGAGAGASSAALRRSAGAPAFKGSFVKRAVLLLLRRAFDPPSVLSVLLITEEP
jgi:hypothetical protein